MTSKPWHAWFLCGFAAALIGASAWLRSIEPRPVQQERLLRSAIAAWKPPRTPLDPTAKTAAGSKLKQLFWVNAGSDDPGFGVRLVDDPALFEDVFPGYEAIRAEGSFWREYLSLPFDSLAASPLVEQANPYFRVWVSWLGNIGLFRRYGGDIVVFGNSESFHAVRPSLIAAARPGARVLMVTKGAQRPRMTARTAQALASSGRKAKLSVWGYSIWSAYQPPSYSDRADPSRAALESFLAGGYESRSNGALPRGSPWHDLMPAPDRREVARWLTRNHVAARIEGLSAMQDDSEEGFRFPLAALERPDVVSQMADLAESRFEVLEGVSERDCDMSRASAEVDQALKAMRSMSRRVIVFLTPTTPLHARMLPACFRPAVVKMLQSKSGDGVVVETGDWRTYGLDYADFAEPDSELGWMKLDVNHVNREGSLKVSRKLLRLAETALRTNLVSSRGSERAARD